MNSWCLCLSLMFVLLTACVSTTPAPETTASAESPERTHFSWAMPNNEQPFELWRSMVCENIGESTRVVAESDAVHVFDIEVPAQTQPVQFQVIRMEPGLSADIETLFAPPSDMPVRCRVTVTRDRIAERGEPNMVRVGLVTHVMRGERMVTELGGEGICADITVKMDGIPIPIEESDISCYYRLSPSSS